MSTVEPFDPSGRAYGRERPSADETIIHCGPGTLGGELLRRYWQPVALAEEATELPKQIKVLDEELILYRDKSGTAGLLYPRCMHRGTSLLYGKVEQRGIRCCYHGWLFDERGHCLEMPADNDNPARNKIRQPWYPVVEKYGLIFSYLGPANKQPAFPRFSVVENLAENEAIISYRREAGPNGGGAMPAVPKLDAKADYNWWQMFDNYMDAFHVYVLHNNINGTQFEESLGVLPEVKFEYTQDGVRSVQHRPMEDGRIHQRLSQVILPNMNATAGVTDRDLRMAGLNWNVPIDDTSYVCFGLARHNTVAKSQFNIKRVGMLSDQWGPQHGRPFLQWSLQDHQRWQTDYIAQKAQGDISLHSEEHLTATDTGISMMRRLFRKQAQVVAGGGDPIGVTFDEPRHVQVQAGNCILDADTMTCVEGFDGRNL